MSAQRCIWPALVGLLGVLAGGCALTDKSTPIRARYFSPAAQPSKAAGKKAARNGAWLRLYRIRAGSHLKHKTVYRDSAHEVRFDEERRWAELPEDYLRRALSRELFERRGFMRVTSGNAPTLEVELTDFDVFGGSEPRARVGAVIVLHELGRASLERTIAVDKPLPEDDADDPRVVAKVMGAALDEVVVRIADQVIGKLERASKRRKPAARPASAPPPPPAKASPEDD